MREPLLTLEGVSRRFGRGRAAVQAVREATLRVFGGELLAVMGPSGSGKSTLLCLMAGLLRPDRGEVAIAGQPLAALSDEGRARLRRYRVGFVFQNFNLLRALSALENVELGLSLTGFSRGETRRRAERQLQEVGLAERSHALPRDLSGGEQQRVALARALVTEPALVFADEPTGNLDAANGRRVMELLRAHVRRFGAAAVVVTHDHRVAQAVDRRLWMEDGVISEFDDEDGVAPASLAV